NWLWRPGVLVLFALTLVGIFYPIFKQRREKQKKGRAENRPAEGKETADRKQTLRYSAEDIFVLSIIALLGWALWESKQFGFRAGLFPWAIGFPLLALATAQWVTGLTGKRRSPGAPRTTDAVSDLPKELVYRRTAEIMGWIVGFFLAIWLLGFSIAVPVTTVLYLKVGAREKWPFAILVAVLAWGFFYGLFGTLLHVPFPEGKLLIWLGLAE
ncbi:MAG: tripartite tricarboxylate transporter TctB family protein, partial [Candidatus Binatia bacterium]